MQKNLPFSLLIIFAILLTGLIGQARTACTVGASQIHPPTRAEFNAFRKKALDLLKEGGLVNVFTVSAELSMMAGAFNAQGSTLTIDSAAKNTEISFDLITPDLEKLTEMGPEAIAAALKDYVSFKKLVETYRQLPRAAAKTLKSSCDTLAAGRGSASFICKDEDDQNVYIAVSYSRRTNTGSVSMNNGPLRMFKNDIACK